MTGRWTRRDVTRRRRGRRSGRSVSDHAIESFVADSGRSLFRLAVVLSADVTMGEDLYQETLLRLATRWETIDEPLAWSRRVMRNLAFDRYRANVRRLREVEAGEGERQVDQRTVGSFEAVEVRDTVLEALGDLNETQRAVIALRFLDDRSEAEVAEMLSLPIGTVKSNTARAVGILRNHPRLQHLFPDSEATG
ncbi:MAG: RNA polymerase sigma factor [Acidimicrobiales bacterium]